MTAPLRRAAASGEPWTPGPWHVEDPLGPEIVSIVASGPNAYDWLHVAQLGVDSEPDELSDQEVIPEAQVWANACLITAAPDLYSALKWFIDDIDGIHTVMTEFDDAVARARAALALARSPDPRSAPAKDGGASHA